MENITEELYPPTPKEFGFVPEPRNHRYGPHGLCWRQAEERGDGYYWIYGQKDRFTIKIHDFSFWEDSFLEFNIPTCLSVTYYESISGEELSPCRRLTAQGGTESWPDMGSSTQQNERGMLFQRQRPALV